MIFTLMTSALAAPPTVSTTYRISLGPEAIAALKREAVERSLEPFGPFTRPFARRRLEALFKACPELKVELAGVDFMVQCQDEPVFRWQVGREGMYEGDTGPLKTQLSRRGDDLLLDFREEEGGKLFTYVFSANGMSVTHLVQSKKLPVDMTWTVPYVRASTQARP
ncbi:MAG: hypothetical protein AAGA48_09040 [Myxococcota bacterium]